WRGLILVDSPPTGGFISLSRRHSDKHQLVIHIPCPPTLPDQVENGSLTVWLDASTNGHRRLLSNPTNSAAAQP
ncbi:MAG TPA: hypothetical protein VHX38_03830, partial [Pseudonocardiaceae bacterium]|nr:hypothetical protein [Pseudonocardiaceae bacterium]